jgi:hypothetical protein
MADYTRVVLTSGGEVILKVLVGSLIVTVIHRVDEGDNGEFIAKRVAITSVVNKSLKMELDDKKVLPTKRKAVDYLINNYLS